jgi:hypothetical protein
MTGRHVRMGPVPIWVRMQQNRVRLGEEASGREMLACARDGWLGWDEAAAHASRLV